jgi:hypothetical protein
MCKRLGTNFGRVARPFVFFLLPNASDWIIPLQYVNAEELVWLFRVADPFGFKKVGFSGGLPTTLV